MSPLLVLSTSLGFARDCLGCDLVCLKVKMSRRRAVFDDDEDDVPDPAPQLVTRSRHPRAAHRRAASSAEIREEVPIPPIEPQRHSASQVERGQSSQPRGRRQKRAARKGARSAPDYVSEEDFEPPLPVSKL